MSITSLSLESLKEAVRIQEQIESLQARLSKLVGEESPAPTKESPNGRRKMSTAARAKIAAAAKARWARVKSKTPAKSSVTAGRASKKKGLTPEGRARLAASMKARWAARKVATA